MSKKDIIILGIESSCDDTSAAILKNEAILSNEIAGQKVHEAYGGVVPELASRAHQQNILPVVDAAIKNAKIHISDIDAVAFTRGPGLLGSLIVGTSFAKSFALGLDIPIVEVNHMHGHVLAHFIDDIENNELKEKPSFPFLCLTVSGGHTQVVLVRDHLDMEVVGTTKDDAAGEAFDKTAKLLGLPYPGGPLIDKYAKEGDANAFKFTKPEMANFDFSFSGLKTNVLQFLQRETKKDKDFIEKRLPDICASLQKTIVDILFDKLIKAAKHYSINEIAIAGGVSANSGIRKRLLEEGEQRNWKTYIPKFEYCTDNAAMIAITGRFHYLNGKFADQSVTPQARMKI
ncbi:tRNA (adenosine(37)-N6)-threonylcarbamoyltransferase complex transferase subunit TsaD [Brumimicrobium aurantiacum]|uniref:tRNA N6-adenosine threonylcarbamoyltransferase n=1 Tax=Brumimicrobium aurantiacum TaxID=1737063 RepID=A0A3E1F065_9FLAO|nr:tRNA (adenosine(37)-N6)-threonylcarbamoyltransferase complex transferase subunit TsaD [Brumimicrobium aurantiacum]RFC55188.1 tRNA (adenosine(37)-N6)-threonylcarbamoyltransferase complex transferase subunit TsaD [Brumimicrobium aurantiacum]